MSKPRRSPLNHEPKPRFRLSGLKITDYKAIDHLELSLPAPTLPDTPDVFVLGSKNGVGKTSVLECAAIAVIGAVYSKLFDSPHFASMSPFEPLIRAGATSASIVSTLTVGDNSASMTSELQPTKLITLSSATRFAEALHTSVVQEEILSLSRGYPSDHRPGDDLSHFESLLGRTSEPLLLPPLLSFHSYRKVAEGYVELGVLAEPRLARRRLVDPFARTSPLSTFKVTLIRALMQLSGLFEPRPASSVSDDSLLNELNMLIDRYAGGKVTRLGADADNGLDLRITPNGGGESYSFDGLSSGQKEIIATMFLIWFTTADQPSVVLIDEPELHLNPEWQRSFVHDLTTLAPHNQYILATHAEEIFGSVPAANRLMLSRED